MDAEINKIIYVELYLGAKMVDDLYLKMNNVRSIYRDSTVYIYDAHIVSSVNIGAWKAILFFWV
jgi:hypothetical protein